MQHNLFWWLTVVLAAVTLIAVYAQFQVGDDDKPIRDRLEDWYGAIQQSDWTGIVLFAMRAMERFFNYVFGEGALSLRFNSWSVAWD